MTGLSFSLPGLAQASDWKQLRSGLLRMTEELQYALTNLDSENFSKAMQDRLQSVEDSAQKAGEKAQEADDTARSGFQQAYEEIIRAADELSSEFSTSLDQREDSIISQVTEDFTAKSETAQLEEEFRSELEQTSQAIEMRFSDAASLTK